MIYFTSPLDFCKQNGVLFDTKFKHKMIMYVLPTQMGDVHDLKPTIIPIGRPEENQHRQAGRTVLWKRKMPHTQSLRQRSIKWER